MPSILLHVEVLPIASFRSAAQEAIELSSRVGIPVRFIFNGIEMIVQDKDYAVLDRVEAVYEKRLAESRETAGSVPAQCYQNPGPGYFAHTTKLPERAKELLAELEMTERAKDTRPEPLL